MVRLAAHKLIKKNLTGAVRVMDADTLRLPFHSNTFQVTSVGFGIRNVSDLKAQMEFCGLQDVKIYARTLGIVTIHVGQKP